MVEEAGSQSAWQDDDDGHDHDDGQEAGTQLFLQVELHSLSAWGPHDDEESGRECRLGGAPHIPHEAPGVSAGDCSPLVLVSVTGC